MKVCENCGKGTVIGKSGAHRYGGGWAMRAPKHRKIWKPNLHTAQVKVDGQFRRMRLCTKCLRKIKKEAKTEVKLSEQAPTSPATV